MHRGGKGLILEDIKVDHAGSYKAGTRIWNFRVVQRDASVGTGTYTIKADNRVASPETT